ncbi:immunity 49 family protein [Catenovulum sp. SM1970]|uniref:Imm49 family immunity protein n=1 Tax=Marinifaba aquimaris TaxID=2741323 RepID=UPI001571ADB9|nr:Imm49 family immunity protein [Marinifaba aquimaris]NTS77883.1 immunity 49 family protein [Marinifaba aquimaris]
MLKLNKYEPDDLEELYDDLNYMIEHRIPEIKCASASYEDKQNATFWVTQQYIEVGFTHYALENYDQVKLYLEKAAPYAFLRGFDPELRTHNTDLSIHTELNLVLLFGDDALHQKLAASKWTLEGDDIMYLACLMYDHLLIKLGTGQTLKQIDIDAALEEAKNSKERDVLQYILPLIEAIDALVNKNQQQWQSSIDKVIDWHTDQAKFGWLNDIIEGFINLNALTLAKLGKTMHGWQCETHSLYLPLFLID